MSYDDCNFKPGDILYIFTRQASPELDMVYIVLDDDNLLQIDLSKSNLSIVSSKKYGYVKRHKKANITQGLFEVAKTVLENLEDD